MAQLETASMKPGGWPDASLPEHVLLGKFDHSVSLGAWAYNEELIVESFLTRAIDLLDRTVHDWEIVFVDDGRTALRNSSKDSHNVSHGSEWCVTRVISTWEWDFERLLQARAKNISSRRRSIGHMTSASFAYFWNCSSISTWCKEFVRYRSVC